MQLRVNPSLLPIAFSRPSPQLPKLDPASFLPTPDPRLGELDAFGTFHEVEVIGLVEDDVADEELPLNFEGVIVDSRVGDFLPDRKSVV
jgi:hypothetical protein